MTKRISIFRREFLKDPNAYTGMAGKDCIVELLDDSGEVKTVLGGNLDALIEEERERLIEEGWIPPDEAKMIRSQLKNMELILHNLRVQIRLHDEE